MLMNLIGNSLKFTTVCPNAGVVPFGLIFRMATFK